ncbi:MAG: hypothetical protein FJX53_11365 [Alphaproteobacteria bacterium]|nr:hypothetical protein [Alphaproteobacteria bacterium]
MGAVSNDTKVAGSLLVEARSAASNVKRYSAEMAALGSSASVNQVLDYSRHLASERANIAAARDHAGMEAYAQAEMGQPGRDVLGEWDTLLAAIDAVLAEVGKAVPKEAGGKLAYETLNADGSTSVATAGIADLKTAASAVAAAID